MCPADVLQGGPPWSIISGATEVLTSAWDQATYIGPPTCGAVHTWLVRGRWRRCKLFVRRKAHDLGFGEARSP